MTALLDLPEGQLPPGLPHPEQLLTPLPGSRPRQLACEIAALREALHCVTNGDTSDVVYGRIDSLIDDRQQELLGIYAAAIEQGAAANTEAPTV